MNEQLLKRLKSFAWRFGGFLLVTGLGWLANNIGLLELNPLIAGAIAYILNEVTKYLNTGRQY